MVKKTQGHYFFADRYFFDTGTCSWKNGFAQLDTGQDASYYGTWANPTTRTIFSFCEGDCYTTVCDTMEEFVAEIKSIEEWNNKQGWGFAIDAYGREHEWKEIGLGHLLH